MKGKGGDGFIKVGDFGLAKIVNQTVTDASSKATPSSRGIIGTPEFMSPEQMQPEKGLDKRSDLYALGTIAYLMLGGRTPFTGDLMQLVMQKIMNRPEPLATLRSDIAADVDAVVMSALEIDPDMRPSSVAEWIASLEEAASDVSERIAGGTRLVIMGPGGAEIYVDDERKGSIGGSGKVVLTGIPPGRHILRVSKQGERDDERVIEIRPEAAEQVIQAQLRPLHLGTASQPSPSQGTSTGGSPASSVMPGVVSCIKCNARFAEGVRFCGRCGGGSFVRVTAPLQEGTFPCPRCRTPLPSASRFCGRCGLHMGRRPSGVRSDPLY